MSNVLDDVKTGAKAGAVKGAAAGALGVLGAKAAGAAQNASGDDLGKRARKAGKQAGKALDLAGKKADVQGKANAAGGLLQMVGKRAGDATDGGVNINIDPNDIPRYLRGLTLVATGLGTLFAPGSPLDATRGGTNLDGAANVDTRELSKQAGKGIDTAADVTQQRIKDWVDLAKDSLSTLSDALTEGIETAESRMQQALDDTEKTLTGATSHAASSAKDALPDGKKSGGGAFRWLMFGLLIGGIVAFLSSPFSGPVGERINNLRRDLGLGGDDIDDSQYWPSPPQETGSSTQDASAGGGDYSPVDLGKSETWNEGSSPKE